MRNIYKALAELQQEIPVILKETKGYGYEYADWATILKAINPLMKKYGLGFTQIVDNNIEGRTIIVTSVFHIDSCEKIISSTLVPEGVQLKGMNDFQVLGSAITYIKRYALSSILGLVTDKDTDAGGEQVAPDVYVPKVEKKQITNKPKDTDVPF